MGLGPSGGLGGVGRRDGQGGMQAVVTLCVHMTKLAPDHERFRWATGGRVVQGEGTGALERDSRRPSQHCRPRRCLDKDGVYLPGVGGLLTNRGHWIAALLEGLPSETPPATRKRLAAALVALFGSDAVVWTTDKANLSRDEAIDLLAWMARALIAATLAEHCAPSASGLQLPTGELGRPGMLN